MSCSTVFDQFRLPQESLGAEIYRRATFNDVWLNLVPRDTYKAGTGLVQSSFTAARSEPSSDEETWSPVTLSSGNTYTGSCGVTYNDTYNGFDELTYGPEVFGLRGPTICEDDLIYNFNAENFLEAYMQALTKRSTRSVQNRLHVKYRGFVPKTICTSSYTTYSTDTTNTALTFPVATSQLTQEMLDVTAAELNQSGANTPDSAGWLTLGQDGPVYSLLIGQQASQAIQLNNEEFRQDYRWAEPSELIKRMGATRVIKNFRHVVTLFPARYNYDGTNYLRVNTWLNRDGTKGKVPIINPEWQAADYEAAIVINPWVMTEELVKPVNSAAGMNWSPKNYFGEWMFVTGGKEISEGLCFDPLKKLGAHFAEYHHAIKPIFPEFGRYILFKRCQLANFDTVTCS